MVTAMRTDNTIEFDSAQHIEEFNARLLQEHVKYCYEHSRYYRRLFDEKSIKPDAIRTRGDLALLPVTSKEDIEKHAEEFLCVPQREAVDLCQTSGTTGEPVMFLQTAADLERLGYNEEISFRAAGVTENDRVMITCALGRCFMAGIAYYEGVKRIGAMAIRAGSGKPALLAREILLYRPSVVVCVPSQGVQMGESLQACGIDPAGVGVRLFIGIGEPVRTGDLQYSPLGLRLSQIWKCQVAGTYASTEIATSFTDCTSGCGGHFHPELITVEVLDENQQPLGPGQPGEIVATPLQVTGMPLLRYCTGDIAAYFAEPCKCGRNTWRMGPIIGRKQQKMKIRGTTVYPGGIFSVLQQIPAIKNYYLEVSGDYELSENVRVVVGVEDVKAVAAEDVAEKIRQNIRIKPQVVIAAAAEVEKKTIQEGKRKAVTFFDNRHTAKTPVM
jgi:phenylacetate-CoA ligase